MLHQVGGHYSDYQGARSADHKIHHSEVESVEM
jgi:hypothetical protein